MLTRSGSTAEGSALACRHRWPYFCCEPETGVDAPVRESAAVDELCGEVERIADLLDARPEAAGEAITAFNTTTGHDYDALDFAEYDGSRSLAPPL